MFLPGICQQAFPAENLLKSGTNCHWKCKAGETTATVVIQLEASSIISGIDIGNSSSAFVEVLVGRESVPDEFTVGSQSISIF